MEASTTSKPLLYFIGHVTKDISRKSGSLGASDFDQVPGGGVFYGSLAANAQGADTIIHTCCNAMDKDLFSLMRNYDGINTNLIGIPSISLQDSVQTTTCENIYPKDNPRERITKFHAVAGPLEPPSTFSERIDTVIISPIAGEFSGMNLSGIRNAIDRKKAQIAADVQGFIRHVVSDNNGGYILERRDWIEKEEYLPNIDILKVDDREATILTSMPDFHDSCVQLSKWGPRIVLCTHTEGLTVLLRDSGTENYVFHEEKWMPGWTILGRTGRGDTCLASFVTAYCCFGWNAEKSTRWAARLTSKKMTHAGPLNIDDVVAVKAMD